MSLPYRALILDMDGVLWRATQPIGDLPATFAAIQDLGLDFALATNNATATVAQFQEKLAGFGVQAAPEQIVTSSIATAHYLAERFPERGSVFVVGEGGLVQALTDKGFAICAEDFALDAAGPVAVVAAMDRQLTYEKLRLATLLIRAGTPFIATNTDRTFPTPQGLTPGAGAIIAALQIATDVDPYVVGKPGSGMYKVALEHLEARPAEVLVVGDRLETDIAGAQTLGCGTALVLSGVSTRKQGLAWEPALDYIAADLAALVARLAEAQAE